MEAPEKLKPFKLVGERERSVDADKEFAFKMMKLDPRDRPLRESYWRMSGLGRGRRGRWGGTRRRVGKDAPRIGRCTTGISD